MSIHSKIGSAVRRCVLHFERFVHLTDSHYTNTSWIICLFIFLALFFSPLLDRVPSGRDWIRYWHPLHDYFSRFGIHYGVIWQEGGGVLTTDDPSTFVFDPVFVVLNLFFSSPLTSVMHLLFVWLLGVFSFNRLLVVRGINSFFLTSAMTVAFGFNGLALSVITEQFLPIYFYVPFFFLSLDFALKKKSKKNIGFLSLAIYLLCYTAAPSLAFFTITLVLIFLKKEDKKLLLLSLFLAGIPLSVPYAGLVVAKLRNFAPYSYLAKWSFSPQRLFFVFFPEFFNLPSQSLLWMNHEMPWEAGYSEPYFRSIFAPFIILVGLFSYSKSKDEESTLIPIQKLWIFAMAALLCSMIGILPVSTHDFLQKMPLFLGRYHEKYLLLFFPILTLCAGATLNELSGVVLRKKLLGVFILFITIFFCNALFYTKFIDALSRYTPLVYILIILEFIFFILVGLFATKTHLRNLFIFGSVIVTLPISSNNFERNMKPYSAETDPDYSFVKYFGSVLQGNLVLIPEESTIGPCLKENQGRINAKDKENCFGYLSGGWLGFSIYSPKGYTSFYGFKDLHMKPLEAQIINIKPRYLVMPKKITDPQFCLTLLRREASIVNCEQVYANGYQGVLNVYKLVHANNIEIIETISKYHLRVTMTARTAKVRIPFFIPPHSSVILNGRAAPYYADEFGTIIDQKNGESNEKNKVVIEVIYENYVIKVGAIIAALFLILSMVYGIYLWRSQWFLKVS